MAVSGSTMSTSTLISTNLHSQNITVNLHNKNDSSRPDPVKILQEHVAFGALYDSSERFDPPKCHPQTRIAMLDRIDQWSADCSEDLKPILWLSGPAGSGKSAIAQTLTERWRRGRRITCAFYFWRTSSERNQKTRLAPTIAFELLQQLPSTKFWIETAIMAGAGGIFNRRLTYQLDELVVEPLLGATAQEQNPVVIVIDGLDECCCDLPPKKDFLGQTYESQQQEILDAFRSACQKIPCLRILIVSRPERQIRESFAAGDLKAMTLFISLKDAPNASDDVHRFLVGRFAEVQERYGIERSWPTEDQISKLIQNSSGQFIYPSIVMKHVTQARANPKVNLAAILEMKPGLETSLFELDTVYTVVLRSVSSDSLALVRDILVYLLRYIESLEVSRIFSPPPPENSPSMFEQFLFLSEGEVAVHLADLHSVLDIPFQDTDGPIRFTQATFLDYLRDERRSGSFFFSKEDFLVRYTELLFRHFQLWVLHSGDGMYDITALVDCICCCIEDCPVSKDLSAFLWELIRMELGRYPFDSGRIGTTSPLQASEQLSDMFTSKIKELGNANGFMRSLIKYLKKCNIPEIEPSWFRRYLVRRSLKAALTR